MEGVGGQVWSDTVLRVGKKDGGGRSSVFIPVCHQAGRPVAGYVTCLWPLWAGSCLLSIGGPARHLVLLLPVSWTNIPGVGWVLPRCLQWLLALAARKWKLGLQGPLRNQTTGSRKPGLNHRDVLCLCSSLILLSFVSTGGWTWERWWLCLLEIQIAALWACSDGNIPVDSGLRVAEKL